MSGRVLVTGASGFVGGAILRAARSRGLPALGLVRRRDGEARAGTLHELSAWTEPALEPLLENVEAVIHCASVVHRPDTPLAEYRHFNVEGTRALANACRSQGVRRIVYLSTIKVYGETTLGTIDEATRVAPETPYAETKLEAEALLQAAADGGGPESCVLRSCPVYGVGDKGNVRAMIRAIARRRFAVPGDGSNRKSLVHVSTVASVALAACFGPSTGLFVLSDREAPSVGRLSDSIAAALGRRRPVRIPSPALYAAALGFELVHRSLGRQARVNRALIRKSLSPSVCSPARLENALGLVCHAELYPALCEEVAWLRELGEI